jgi:hypothetical protein
MQTYYVALLFDYVKTIKSIIYIRPNFLNITKNIISLLINT